MKTFVARMWKEDDAVLTFEWVLLVTLLTIGIVSGLAAARDAIIDEMGDVAEAMLALDQSFRIDFPLNNLVHDGLQSGSASDSQFTDDTVFVDCERSQDPLGQDNETDGESSAN